MEINVTYLRGMSNISPIFLISASNIMRNNGGCAKENAKCATHFFHVLYVENKIYMFKKIQITVVAKIGYP